MAAPRLHAPRQNLAMPTGDVIDAFARWYAARGKAPGTVYQRVRYLRRLEADMPDPLRADPDAIAEWIAGHVWAPETRKSARESCCLFFDWADRHGRLPGPNPMADVPPPRLPPPCPHPATDAALARARLRADPRQRLMVDVAACAGLRRAEIAALHTDCLEDCALRIVGKGGRVRCVPIPEELAARLSGLPRGWVFPGRFGGHVCPDHIGRTLSRLMGAGFTAHALRHRYATTIYAATGDLLAVQLLLGHSRPETTARYIAIAAPRLRAASLAAS